ncbi:hypothetical protein XENTR_v10024834 [Xenopus tropicalis]|nr:hypothetical protein XENTR_v10024834 [Xenopus tropicalis]
MFDGDYQHRIQYSQSQWPPTPQSCFAFSKYRGSVSDWGVWAHWGGCHTTCHLNESLYPNVALIPGHTEYLFGCTVPGLAAPRILRDIYL